MSAFAKKSLRIENRAIKMGVFLILALLLGLFFINEAQAIYGGFFTDDFEIYDVGDLTGQGYWEGVPAKYSFQVSTTTSESGTKSLTSEGHPGYGFGNRKNGVGIATTTSGIIKFYFKCDDLCGLSFGLQNYTGGDYDNLYPNILKGMNTEPVYLWGFGTSTILLANSIPLHIYNKITIEYSYFTHQARAKLNNGPFTDFVDLGTLNFANALRLEGMGLGVNIISIDHILSQEELDFYCGYESLCEFCNTSTTCAYYNCFWNTEQQYCYSSIAPELPELEDCSELGITDKLICEIKNFGYRLFVPTPQKITELRETLDLIKEKFPYNYVLAIKDFFAYLKDNINEEQAINISILGQAGIINFNFWNTTTTIAGSEQSFLDIFKKFFSFIIILIFMFWSFSFLKRIFK